MRIIGVDICGEQAKFNSWFDDKSEFIHNNVVRHKLFNMKKKIMPCLAYDFRC